MLEITLNFRISLDLFEFATLSTNYGLQTADKAVTDYTKVVCGILVRFRRSAYSDDRHINIF